MVGIILVSHGQLAEGMIDSARMFFGEEGLEQVTSVALFPGESPETFDEKLTKARKEVDVGEGVVILADLLGGTPGNRAACICEKKVQVICGVNLPLFVELLGQRLQGNEVDIDYLLEVATKGLVHINALMDD